jgi:predicted O-methyltransferase YrrM
MGQEVSQATMELGGTVYRLRFDFNALAEIEELTGKSIMGGGGFKPETVEDIRAFIFACMKSGGFTGTIEDVGDMLCLGDMEYVASTIASIVSTGGAPIKKDSLAPFVQSPETVHKKVLDLARVRDGDHILDLGCGLGDLLVMGAADRGARGVGVEMDGERVRQANANVKAARVTDKVQIKHANMITEPHMKDWIAAADIIYIYLLSKANETIRPMLEEHMGENTVVISHDFRMPGWSAFKRENVGDPDSNRNHTLYAYLWPECRTGQVAE